MSYESEDLLSDIGPQLFGCDDSSSGEEESSNAATGNTTGPQPYQFEPARRHDPNEGTQTQDSEEMDVDQAPRAGNTDW